MLCVYIYTLKFSFNPMNRKALNTIFPNTAGKTICRKSL